MIRPIWKRQETEYESARDERNPTNLRWTRLIFVAGAETQVLGTVKGFSIFVSWNETGVCGGVVHPEFKSGTKECEVTVKP